MITMSCEGTRVWHKKLLEGCPKTVVQRQRLRVRKCSFGTQQMDGGVVLRSVFSDNARDCRAFQGLVRVAKAWTLACLKDSETEGRSRE